MGAWLAGRLDALLGWGGAAAPRSYLLILLVGLMVVLPGLSTMPVTDRDEARFAQASKQMMETGDLIDIRFQDQPRWKKPVGIYWLQAASATLFSDGTAAPIWAYRAPSALAAVLAALFTVWGARAVLSGRAALLAGLMLMTATLVAGEANIAKTDATLMATAAAALGAILHLWHGTGGRGAAAIFWLAITAAILIKGPIVPTIVLLAIMGTWLVSRWTPRVLIPPLSRFRILPGLAATALLCAPWLVAIWIVSDGAFFAEALGRDLGAKIASGQEKHWGPPGLYSALVWATFWPWAAFLPGAIAVLWAERRMSWLILLAAWVVPFWLILEAVPTKLPHYVLPLYPALAMMVAAALPRIAYAPNWSRWTGALLTAIPGGALALAVVVLPVVLEGQLIWNALVLAGLAAAALTMAVRAALDRQPMQQAAGALIAALALYPATLQFALPSLDTGFASPRLAAAIAPWRPCASGPVHSIGYHEPSLVFLTETEARIGKIDETLAAFGTDPGTMVLLEVRWHTILGERTPQGVERAVVSYFNYNRGKFETARLVTSDDPRWEACVPAG